LWNQLLWYQPFTTNLEQQKRHWAEFRIVSLLFGLEHDLHGFQDQIFTKTLPTTTNTYFLLLCSSLGQNSAVNSSIVASLESSTLVLSTRGRRSSRGDFCGGCRPMVFVVVLVVVVVLLDMLIV
jgi:hypothetical protein